MSWNTLDLIGKTFGRLTVIEHDTNTNAGKSRWVCQCISSTGL